MSIRIKQLNNLLKKEISVILLKREAFSKDLLITVSRVETSKGLDEAKVFISVMPDQQKGEVLQILKKDIYSIQQELNKKLFLRKIPKIVFYQETEIQKADRIEKVLLKIHEKKE